MKLISDAVRLKWLMLTRGSQYSQDMLDRIYKIYLNHNKVIHYRDGYPVYSLSTPAAFSRPAMNFFARIMYRSIQNKNIPNLMSFAVNDICNAACKHCSFFEGVHDGSKKVMTLDQCRQLIADAQDLGVSVINFVGGEPLLRDDFTDILKSVDKDLSTTVVFTNGLLLKDKAAALRKAGLDSVYISIDAPTAEGHDAIRGNAGLFDHAMAGITEAARVGLSTGMSYCITPESYAAGNLEKMVELAKATGVHELLIFDALPTGRYKHREDLVDNTAWVDEIIQHVGHWNRMPEYPGIFVFAYATSHRSVGCSCGTSYFYASPYGDIMSCDFNHHPFGNILDQPLYTIWDEMSSNIDYHKAKWGGCKIKDSIYRRKETVSGDSSCSCS